MKRRIRILLAASMAFASWGCPDPEAPTEDYVSDKIGTLKYVPAGSFRRDGGADNVSVIADPFRMSRYEITRAQFAAIMGTDPSDGNYSGGDGDPAQMTNWYHAMAFCNKLSLAEGLTPVYAVAGVDFAALSYAGIPTTSDDAAWNAAAAAWTNDGYRLPTEMEWMWAAMGADISDPGEMNATGYLKAFAGSTGSNAMEDYAVFGFYIPGETGRTTTERTNPVGSKADGANELGLFDMSGNVWEWCWDWSAVYPSGTIQSDSAAGRGAASGDYKIGRGGGWNGWASSCAVACRYNDAPGYRDNDLGFRVVRP